jgi:DNA-binding CsgD family transcriptional regulator
LFKIPLKWYFEVAVLQSPLKIADPLSMHNGKSSLTPREVEVLGLIAQGMSSVRIAQKLAISFETVKVHRRNMLRKVEAHNTFELIRMAIKKRWI